MVNSATREKDMNWLLEQATEFVEKYLYKDKELYVEVRDIFEKDF